MPQAMTLLRQDPTTLVFLAMPGFYPMEVLPDAAGSPPMQGEPYTAPEPYLPFTAYTTTFRVPDVRIGDELLDPNDTDPATGLPWTYVVAMVRRWRFNHLELALRRAVKATDIAAFNARILASFNQTAQLMVRITGRTPGAAPSGDFDPYRQQVVSQGDGTNGAGWNLTNRNGYLPPLPVTVGVVDVAKIEEYVEGGLMAGYEGPLVYFQAPTALTKGDLLALNDGRRFIVGDLVSPMQVYGVTVLQSAKLEARDSKDAIYQIPVA